MTTNAEGIAVFDLAETSAGWQVPLCEECAESVQTSPEEIGSSTATPFQVSCYGDYTEQGCTGENNCEVGTRLVDSIMLSEDTSSLANSGVENNIYLWSRETLRRSTPAFTNANKGRMKKATQ